MSDALGFLPDTKPDVAEAPVCLSGGGCDQRCADRCYYRDNDVAEAWRKVLADTADAIERDGWLSCGRRGDWLRAFIDMVFRRNPHCVLVTMSNVGRRTGHLYDAWDRFEKHIGGDMVRFNDTPGRTASEVTAALRACARQ